MNDPLHSYMKQHEPAPPPAPLDEWAQILARSGQLRVKKHHRAWLLASAATLSFAAVLAYLDIRSPVHADEDLVELALFHERSEVPEVGAYQDWLWMTDQLALDSE